MKSKIVIVVLVIAATAAAFFIGMKKGANLVRAGLVANYPTIKNVVQSADIEIDSSISFSLTPQDDSALFAMLKSNSKNDSLRFAIPYYGRFGVDLSFRNFRIFENDGSEVEVWLPSATVRFLALKFNHISMNGKFVETTATQQKQIFEYVLYSIFEKNKMHLPQARRNVAKALMFYFMPYKFSLKLYIDNEQQTLPVVPGVNQTVEDAIKEMVGKK